MFIFLIIDKIKEINNNNSNISNTIIIWTDKCEIKFFEIIKWTNIFNFQNNNIILLPPLPWNSLLILDKYIKDYFKFWFIVNDLWSLEYLYKKWVKNIYFWRILLYWLTRTFNNLIYLFNKFYKYNLDGFFINYEDFFCLDISKLKLLKEKKIKLWIHINENMLAYSPRCHYMVEKKEKWDFENIECKIYCESIKKEKSILLWLNKEVIYDYKMLLIKNRDFSRIMEDKEKLIYIDYLVYS